MDVILFFLALELTLVFINNKFSSAIRAIAFNEEETENDAKLSLSLMLLSAMLWALFYLYVKHF